MTFELPEGTAPCGKCSSVRYPDFCATCDTEQCGKCNPNRAMPRTENFWVKPIGSCARCEDKYYADQPCPDCKPSEWTLPDGSPAMIGSLSGNPNGRIILIPNPYHRCHTCDNTGRIKQYVSGFAPGEAERYKQAIYALRSYTFRYKEDLKEKVAERERQYQQQVDAARYAARARIEKEKADQTRKELEEKWDKERREQKKKAEHAEKECKAIETLRAKCAPEMAAIQAQISALETEGSSTVKIRLLKHYNHPSSVVFRNLQRTLGGSYGTTEELQNLLRQAEMGNITNPFEAYFEYVKQQETNRLRIYLRTCINDYLPSRDDGSGYSVLKKVANYYISDSLPEIGDVYFYTIKTPEIHTGSLYEQYFFRFTTFEEFLTVRNEVWNESWFNRVFREAKTVHFDSRTDAKDEEVKKRWKSQLVFMNDYWEQSRLRLEVPSAYQSSHPDLQREQVRLEYIRSFELRGKAAVGEYYVDDLSCQEVEQRTNFRFFPGTSYTAPTSAPKAIYAEGNLQPRPSSEVGKKVSIEQLQHAWQQYQNLRKNKLLKGNTSPETSTVYHTAKNSFCTDQRRYHILREYIFDEANRHRDFHKILMETFGQNFFTQDSETQSTLAAATRLSTSIF